MNIITSPAPAESQTHDPVSQLHSARRLVEEQYAGEQPLARAALHLIDCATDIVAQLPQGDLAAGRAALGAARAAVVAATLAVRRIRDTSTPGTTLA